MVKVILKTMWKKRNKYTEYLLLCIQYISVSSHMACTSGRDDMYVGTLELVNCQCSSTVGSSVGVTICKTIDSDKHGLLLYNSSFDCNKGYNTKGFGFRTKQSLVCFYVM